MKYSHHQQHYPQHDSQETPVNLSHSPTLHQVRRQQHSTCEVQTQSCSPPTHAPPGTQLLQSTLLNNHHMYYSVLIVLSILQSNQTLPHHNAFICIPLSIWFISCPEWIHCFHIILHTILCIQHLTTSITCSYTCLYILYHICTTFCFYCSISYSSTVYIWTVNTVTSIVYSHVMFIYTYGQHTLHFS